MSTKTRNGSGIYARSTHWRTGKPIFPKNRKALRFRNRAKDSKPKDDDDQMSLAV